MIVDTGPSLGRFFPQRSAGTGPNTPARRGTMSEFTRRDVLKLGGAAAAGLGFPTVLRAQSTEVPMLGLWSFTGAFSDVGPVLDRGMKIKNKTIKYITRDDETKAGSATRRAEEAVDADGVKYIIGPWSSG